MMIQSQLTFLLLILGPLATQAFAPHPLKVVSNVKRFYQEGAELGLETKLESEKILPKESKGSLAEKMNRLTRPRPHPLFLMEKCAGIVDGAMEGLAKTVGVKDNRSEDASGEKTKERVVVLGIGWGSTALIKNLDTEMFDITVVSPRNHFVFTPMLAGSSVGSVEYRSFCEPIREINHQAKYLEATATSVDPETNTITCESVVCDEDGEECTVPDDFTVEYDRLVVTVGARTNTFGIPGVLEHCEFLREVEDARRIRAKLVNCFERASIPDISDEERRHRLTFAIVGAGPSGIEFASELRDFVEQDGPKYYPELLKFVSIKVIEATDTVLAPFEKSLQEEAIRRMNRPVKIKDPVACDLPEDFVLQELLLNRRVAEVEKEAIVLEDGTRIKYGLALWAGGNGPLPLTEHLVEVLGKPQEMKQSVARGRIAIDPWLRALGGKGEILALGDCSCIVKGQLPATGQVAAQQGEYLADLMNKHYNLSPSLSEDGAFPPPTRDPEQQLSLSESIAQFSTQTSEYAPPFQFLNLGILAYTGDCTALAQVATSPETPPFKSTGTVGNAMWRSVYLAKQVSWRNRLLVLNDWMKRVWFGRDITQL